MVKQTKHQPTAFMKVAILLLTVAAMVAVLWLGMHRQEQPDGHPANAQIHLAIAPTNLPPKKNSSATTNHAVTSSASSVAPNYPDFQIRPLPVAYDSPNFQWTTADGKDTNIIRELAHNPLEYARMVDENSRIFKRELVYLKETAAAVLEKAKLTGQPVQQLTLPGVDGQELPFQITKSQGSGSSRQGMFAGHLVSNPDSTVTMAFEDGREAFTILDPKDKIFVVGEPREDGQVIVKAIDPNTYGLGPAEQGDDSIKTGSANK